MAHSLCKSLQNMLGFAYPNEWRTAWLSLPIISSIKSSHYRFQVICSDLPRSRTGTSIWPPVSRDPNVWLRWESTTGAGFWLRPRQFDPILRDRFNLLEPDAINGWTGRATISHQGLQDACQFAVQTGRLVWHNPPKGGPVRRNPPTSNPCLPVGRKMIRRAMSSLAASTLR